MLVVVVLIVKKLLIGIYKYDFLKPQFQIVDVSTQRYPDYIDTVPTLVVEQRMIKNDDVFGYMNNMVEQIFKQNPQLKETISSSTTTATTTTATVGPTATTSKTTKFQSGSARHRSATPKDE